MVQAPPQNSFAAASATEVRLSPEQGARRLRLYYVPLSMVGAPDQWPGLLDACAGMGFDTILISQPGDPGPTGNLLLPYDWSKPHPAMPRAGATLDSVASLADECQSRGLRLMIDLVVDRVAAQSPLATALGLQGVVGANAQDPRLSPAERGGIAVPFADGDRGRRSLDHLAGILTGLAQAGVAGFRCLRPDHVPASTWAELRAAARKKAADARMLAWMPGVAADHAAALTGAGFDGSFSSLRWWDCRADWLIDEHERLRVFGPSIAFPEAPFESRLAHVMENAATVQHRLERAVWLAATLGDGVLVPMGFEFGADAAVPVVGPNAVSYASLRGQPRFDIAGTIQVANRFIERNSDGFATASMRLLAGGGAASAVLRCDASDARRAQAARLVLINPSLDAPAAVRADALSPEIGPFLPMRDALGSSPNLTPEAQLSLRPGEVRVLEGQAAKPIVGAGDRTKPKTATEAPRLAIEAISPVVDGGRYAVKRIVGELVQVEADAFGEGHDPIAVALFWRAADEDEWHERRMTALGNDRYAAELPLERVGRYEYAIEAWRDEFAIFRGELVKKHDAGLAVPLELEEGRRLLADILKQAAGSAAARLKPIVERLGKADDAERLRILLAQETSEVAAAADPRHYRLRSEACPVESERPGAGFASWYELFPRSQSGDIHRHGTFDDVIKRLPAIRAMGFDVLYFPPIHPIGKTNRKGPNNSLTAGPSDPGSPYAIGSADGGHDAIHPELGTFEDFDRLVAAAADHGLEIALDFAIQASPDHPWLKQHPEWFTWRPDGTIRYAENPPKKYEDIVNVDFYTEGAKPSLWVALCDAIKVWADHGVRLFRIDNPHTKPYPFWEWCIADIRRTYPDAVFLAEAFTRPKVMYRLAKIGFSQSYTYFTWRNTKQELTEYLTELTTQPPKDFFRPHFFVNTPDINPDFLQNAPRSAYLIRTALATTLSGLWGMYSGFELCEGRPDVKKKEYADSEKYQLVAWDYDRPGNIIGEITRLNRIRRDNPALHSHLGITFLEARNDNILFFEKATPSRDNVVIVAISLDPHTAQEADVELPLWRFGLPDHGSIGVVDLMRGHRFTWTGKIQRIRLDPGELPFSIWRLGAARDI